jgi:biopolymer transport protein ExbB/biopolymer transport protein TolQ
LIVNIFEDEIVMGISLLELWGTMGWFAKGIVYLLLLMSIFVATVALRKGIQMARARRATLHFSGHFSRALATLDFAEAEKLVVENPKSHLANAFRRVFSNITEYSRDAVLTPAEVASVQRVIELNTLEQISGFRRGLGALATVGSTAPFVGLLGTTIGVVNSFTGMANAGSGGLAAVSAGIAEALITTAIGIGVALPAVWLFNYFTNRIDFISMEITYATKEFMDFLLRYEAGLTRRVGA